MCDLGWFFSCIVSRCLRFSVVGDPADFEGF